MDAYASVNDPTRRKMEEMLKTWKEPVPGSIDKNPVFPADSVRPIETALIKARTSALQAQQEQMRTQQQLFGRGGRSSAAPYRATPTPPNARQQPFNQPSYPGANGHRPESALGQQVYQQHQVRARICLVFGNSGSNMLSEPWIRWINTSTATPCISCCVLPTSAGFLWRPGCPGWTKHRRIE